MASGQQQQQTQQNQGSTYFSDPGFVQQLLQSLGPQMGQFNDYLSNPTASPLYTNQLRGLMASLAPQEAASRQAYTDTGVAAGNRSSGRFAQGAANLEGNIIRNQQATAGDLLGKTFGQVTQALIQAMGLTPQLLNALKLQQNSGSSQGTSSGWNDGSGGAGGGGGGGSGLSNDNPFWSQNDPYFQDQMRQAQQRERDISERAQRPGSTSGEEPPPPQYNPPPSSTWFDSNGNFVSGGGNYNGNNFATTRDQFGYTPQDWQNDLYFK